MVNAAGLRRAGGLDRRRAYSPGFSFRVVESGPVLYLLYEVKNARVLSPAIKMHFSGRLVDWTQLRKCIRGFEILFHVEQFPPEKIA